MVLLQQLNQVSEVVRTNQVTERYGLALSEEDAALIAAERTKVLQEQKRVEFGGGIMPKIIYEFCDSSYIDQNNYVDTLIGLQEIFYLYKNEMQDEISDDELLHFMKEQFERRYATAIWGIWKVRACVFSRRPSGRDTEDTRQREDMGNMRSLMK